MADYGIKIAKANHDVSDGERYLVMFSKYPVLKLKASGQGNIVYTSGEGVKTVEITHSLGYVPLCFVSGQYFDTDLEAVVARYGDWNRYIYRGLQVADLYYYDADTTKLYIVFVPAPGVTTAYSFTLPYMYHIFYDEDTL